MSELYPGQAYVHQHNANVKRAEENWMTKQALNQCEKSLQRPLPCVVHTKAEYELGALRERKACIQDIQDAIGDWGGPEREHYTQAARRAIVTIENRAKGLDLSGNALSRSTLPESGALREALERLYVRPCAMNRCDHFPRHTWEPILAAVRNAALSLSSPIEPTVSAEVYFDEAECYYELPQSPGTIQDAIETLQSYETEVRLAAIAFAKAYAERARPTSQASSEIRPDPRKAGSEVREALEKLLLALVSDLREREGRNKNSGHPSLQGFAEAAGYAAAKIEQIIGSERWREALAPSRKGAGGK